MTDKTIVNTKQFEKLQNYLTEKYPDLKKYIIKAEEDYAEVRDEYSLFSWALRPYINDLYDRNQKNELKSIWDLIEVLSTNWGESAKSEIFLVTGEEMDLSKFYDFLGPTIKKHWFDCLVWYPEYKDRKTKMNTHINKEKYISQWKKEIEKIGGFRNLNQDNINYIHRKLARKFKIEKWYPR